MLTSARCKIGWIKSQTFIKINSTLWVFIPFSVFVVVCAFLNNNVLAFFSFFAIGKDHDAVISRMGFPFSGWIFNPNPGNHSIVIQILKWIFIEFAISVIIGRTGVGTSFIF